LSRINEIADAAFANVLAICLYLLFHSIYDIKLMGLSNYTASPSTIIAINHKRDLDALIVAPTLHLRKTAFNDKLRMHFIARDDLFYPGYLTAHFPVFGIMGGIIHRINLAPVMKALRAHPISHLVRNRIGFLMREIIQIKGNLCLKHVVNPSGLDMFANLLGMQNSNSLGDITVSDFLGYPFCKLHQQTTDTDILQNGLSQTIRNKTLMGINQQLGTFAQILDEGGTCMFAPEGQLSPDGRFGPVKSGLYRLISMTTGNIKVLPVNTTYDFMTQGRMRVYVTIGPEIADLREWNKTELEQQIQKNIVNLGPVTLGQLGSEAILGMLNDGYTTFQEQELVDILSTRIEKLNSVGVRLDKRMVNEKSMRARVRDFLNYCVSKNIISPSEDGSSYLVRPIMENDTRGKFHQNPLRYSANELKSHLEFYSTYKTDT